MYEMRDYFDLSEYSNSNPICDETNKKTITSGQTNFFEKVGTLLENKKKFSNIFFKFKIRVFFECYGDIKLNFLELLNCNF